MNHFQNECTYRHPAMSVDMYVYSCDPGAEYMQVSWKFPNDTYTDLDLIKVPKNKDEWVKVNGW